MTTGTRRKPQWRNPWHLVGALAVTALACFVASIAGTVILVVTEPRFHPPVSDNSALEPEWLAALEEAAHARTTPTSVSVDISVPHDMVREIPAQLAETGDRRGWLFGSDGRTQTVTLPANDLQLLQDAGHNPVDTIEELAKAPTASDASTMMKARINWHQESAPHAQATANAIVPSMLSCVALTIIYIIGWPHATRRREGRPA